MLYMCKTFVSLLSGHASCILLFLIFNRRIKLQSLNRYYVVTLCVSCRAVSHLFRHISEIQLT